MLAAHKAVREVAVVGRADAEGLIKPQAFVVPNKSRRRRTRSFRPPSSKPWQAQLAPYKYPRWIEFVPELLKTATGKPSDSSCVALVTGKLWLGRLLAVTSLRYSWIVRSTSAPVRIAGRTPFGSPVPPGLTRSRRTSGDSAAPPVPPQRQRIVRFRWR